MAKPRLTAVTLGVRDIRASTRFYEAIGFVRKFSATGDAISFMDGGSVAIALWSADELSDDAALPRGTGSDGFGGVTLAWNRRTTAEVDSAFANAVAAGARVLRQPSPTDYGGYRAYFADPDGHVWEIVTAPGFELTDDGAVILPD